MQQTVNNQNAMMARRRIQSSDVISRRNMQRPAIQNKQVMVKVNERMKVRTAPVQQAAAPKVPAKVIKEQEIQKALATAKKVDAPATKAKKKASKKSQVHFGFGRIMLAMACAAAAVFAIVYFVNLNAPDISLKVAAMQTGIEASYPSYVPRDFNLSDITSENGKVTLNFRNASTGDAFSIIEEKSSWDSNALLTNYVKDAFGSDYATIKEQGLTLYIGGGNAAWVNRGVVFKIRVSAGLLTKKQIRSIAVSL